MGLFGCITQMNELERGICKIIFGRGLRTPALVDLVAVEDNPVGVHCINTQPTIVDLHVQEVVDAAAENCEPPITPNVQRRPGTGVSYPTKVSS